MMQIAGREWPQREGPQASILSIQTLLGEKLKETHTNCPGREGGVLGQGLSLIHI